jgi:NhaP-type Na+/H+ or K+/H+ antiporter
MFVKVRFVTVSAVKETLLIFLFGYAAYLISDLLHMSGIISLLTSGVIMAHYAWYSLSPQGKNVSSLSFQVLGFLAEAFVFAYLGLSLFAYIPFGWSWEFIIIEIMIIIVGRFLGTICSLYMLLICKHKPQVTFR